MIRKREVAGITLFFLGLGIVLAQLLQWGFCMVLVGIGCMVVGGCLLRPGKH